jgi:hypothetical protein
MALLTTLLSPGVLVTATTQAVAPIPTPTTIPLLFIATRANKPAPDGSGIADGTTESNIMRIITSQSELLQTYGNPIFVTSDGLPIHGDETNEYGLLTSYSVCGITNLIYVVRADIDLGQLVPTTVEPTFPPPDSTYWIDTTSVVGGILTFNGSTWAAVPFTIYTTAPTGGDGSNGDWAFDYSTLNGTIMFKAGGTWYDATTTNIEAQAGATNPLYVSSTTPVGAVAGDFWYKTTSSSGGTNLALARYRASDAVWVTQAIIRQDTAPDPTTHPIWEDTSAIATTGDRPLYIGTGVEFIALTVFIQDTAPVVAPDDGTLWFDDTITDFALYREGGNDLWYSVETTTVSNPTALQKVISASPPQFPQTDAIWVDVSTEVNLDNFPVIKKWSGTEWVVLPSSDEVDLDVISIHVQSHDPIASLILDFSYWLNIGELKTRNIVKRYNSDFVAHTVNNSNQVVVEVDNHWEPVTDDIFGRKSQRHMVASALKQAIADNDEIRSETNYYQLIACPGYVETYPDIGSLNQDINQIALALFDVPKFVTPSGVPEGREITITEWITNTRGAIEPNEDGFPAGQSADPYQANAYPGGLATNPTDGQLVYMPPTHILLRTIAYNDSVAYPWSPPAGPNRGIVTNVSSVGRINNEGEYVQFSMNRAQRDICYTHSINPIATIPNVGLCVWGQKTMAIAGSILDRINVVRLICKMKYDFSRLMLPFLFELNNATTRRNATIVAQRYLAGLASLQAIYDYAVLCDDSNNTGAIIAEHKLIVDVAIKPEQSIEFIYVPILVLNPSDTFPF